MTPIDDPILGEFSTLARSTFGNRIEHMVLYGSRARGEASPDSDYDIAIFVRDLVNAYEEFAPLADFVAEMLADRGIEINARLFPAEVWRANTTAFIGNVRRDGLAL